MKKFTKRIALLLAGLLLTTSLFACDSGNDWADEDEDEDEEQSESSSQYKNLTPEEVGEALLEAKNFTIVMEGVRTIGNASITATYTITKNGDLIKMHLKQATPSEAYEKSAYYDLKEQNAYEENNGEWIYAKQENLDLENMLSDLIPVHLLFDKDCYDVYDPEKKEYVLNPAEVSDEMTADETAIGKGEMTSQRGIYTFDLSAEQGTNQIKYTINIQFTADNVKLPDAKPANQGEASPDETPTPMPSPEADNH
jgi:hypothetical protein